jgi:hypothetical protein
MAPAPPPPLRLRRALDAAALSGFPPTEELREAACAYVDTLRVRGFTPERVLVAVKTAFAELPLPPGPPDRSLAAHGALVATAAQWCIARYFRAD